MIIANRPTVKIRVDTGGGDEAVFICRWPTPEERDQYQRRHLEVSGGQIVPQVRKARLWLMAQILHDSNLSMIDSAGAVHPLGPDLVISDEEKVWQAGQLGRPIETWTDLINPLWLESAAMYFDPPKPVEDKSGEPFLSV